MLNEFIREQDEKQAQLKHIMDDLKEQIRQLTSIVADLTALKNKHQSEVGNNQLNNEDILSDLLSDVLPFDVELSSNQPVPETPPEPSSMTQSIPLAVVNSGVMLPPLSVPPSLRSPLSTIDQNAPLV